MLQPKISIGSKIVDREYSRNLIQPPSPREYNGLTSPVMKKITLFSHQMLLIQVLKTNSVSL